MHYLPNPYIQIKNHVKDFHFTNYSVKRDTLPHTPQNCHKITFLTFVNVSVKCRNTKGFQGFSASGVCLHCKVFSLDKKPGYLMYSHVSSKIPKLPKMSSILSSIKACKINVFRTFHFTKNCKITSQNPSHPLKNKAFIELDQKSQKFTCHSPKISSLTIQLTTNKPTKIKHFRPYTHPKIHSPTEPSSKSLFSASKNHTISHSSST